MRHNKKFNHLGRTASHRNAMLANMATSLILSEHKRITTTLAKAKALKKYVEPLITRSKNDTTTSRRVVFRYLQNKYAVKALFGEVAEKVANRPGGYTRVIHLEGGLAVMLIDKIIRTDVGHIDSVVRIITQHLLRQFLESLEAMRSTDLEERVAIFLHHGREKIIASLNHVRIFPFRVAVAVVIDQCLQAGESHVSRETSEKLVLLQHRCRGNRLAGGGFLHQGDDVGNGGETAPLETGDGNDQRNVWRGNRSALCGEIFPSEKQGLHACPCGKSPHISRRTYICSPMDVESDKGEGY